LVRYPPNRLGPLFCDFCVKLQRSRTLRIAFPGLPPNESYPIFHSQIQAESLSDGQMATASGATR